MNQQSARSARPVPAGREGAIPYLTVRSGSSAIEFYKRAFGAQETLRIEHEGRVGHAELEIGPAKIMLSDEFPDHEALSPQTIGGTPVLMHLYVEDVDAFTRRAGQEGLKTLRPVADQFYGDRGGKFEDPFGHRWWIASHIEDLSTEEIRRRAAALHGEAPAQG
ncbi:VOC family protein [Methylocella silvestris]|uniref:Glyxoylase n=1 Tax=Methylocella silvestris TaxID=199596 RepID=A0A2J7TCW6_METSI|nr:VOC family protein [Methylocella silvestris]PNG24617.1 glyxoylase [Methylocella silvestris]